ncbi:Adenylosuccinate lyase [Bacteroides luti]|uniref:Adenylosuccinate lyase n=2 Tax=Bacteroides luti TaxID=1297750 RepID=A0A1M5FN48_9BACE|nr:Adenylosuccinate lyase [Bacteroides luti]
MQSDNYHYTMKLDLLTAISPIDGRYRGKAEALAAYFSEFALIKYRVQVEIEYFITLCELPLPQLKGVGEDVFESLRSIYRNFSEADAQRIKDIESVTNHDVKAVEYFIKEEFDKLGGLEEYKEFIHFGLTSQDINNTSIPLSIKEALNNVYYPLIEELIAQLKQYATDWANVSMLAKTHGQPASPTRLGKEIMVFAYRLERQLAILKACPVTAKFGGATGNYNAHHVAYPSYDWKAFGNRFVSEKLGLEREEYTTQISNYDNLSAVFDAMKRINVIMIDMNRDFWLYISMEYFKQKIKAGEVGSSAMPHKVNPIDFENAEGNLGIANSILNHLAEKLPVSRLQRDLTDSTVLRNIGVPFGHVVIAIQSSLKGLRKLILNETAIYNDLDNCWSVVAEAIQTILRREAYPNPYEALKALTRTNQAITESSIKDFIEELNVSEDVKKELRCITPHSYTGI